MDRPKPAPRPEADRRSGNDAQGAPAPGRTVRLGDLLRPKRAPTSEEAATIADVHEFVAEWAAGRLPTQEVAKLSTGRQRWLATRFTPPDHPLFRPLMALLDELIPLLAATAPTDSPTRGPVYATGHGPIHGHELRDLGARIERQDGDELLVFPVRYPWLVKPNADRGVEGVRGDPVYRPRGQRGPTTSEFGVRVRSTESRDDASDGDGAPWWDR